MTRSIIFVFGIFFVISDVSTAWAGVQCALVEPDFVAIDGMLDDWEGIKGHKTGGAGSDASYEIRCAHDESLLYVAVVVNDDAVIRTSGKKKRNQDYLELALGQGSGTKVQVFPGTRGFKPVHLWRGRAVKAPVQVEDSLQPKGWSMELSVPLASLRGYGRGTPALGYRISYRDWDGRGDQRTIKSNGVIKFAGSDNVYRSFMQSAKLRRSQVKVDRLANIDGGKGVERVIVGGKVIGVINDEYRFVTLPLDRDQDLLRVAVVDLAGEGKFSVVVHYRQHGNGGSRDVLAVWNLLPKGEFSRTLAVEVRKQVGDNVLQNNWRLEANKGRRAKGRRLIVEAGEVVGWDEDSYDDVPPEDMQPILTPWAEQTSAVYQFTGDTSFGGNPL